MHSQQIIRSYYVIAGLYTLSASLIWGVNTLFLLDAGLNIFEVFVANALFSAGMALFEIPTGVLADTRGRRDRRADFPGDHWYNHTGFAGLPSPGDPF